MTMDHKKPGKIHPKQAPGGTLIVAVPKSILSPSKPGHYAGTRPQFKNFSLAKFDNELQNDDMDIMDAIDDRNGMDGVDGKEEFKEEHPRKGVICFEDGEHKTRNSARVGGGERKLHLEMSMDSSQKSVGCLSQMSLP